MGHVSRANQVVLSKWCKPLGFIPKSSHCPVASSPGSFPLDSGNRAYRLLGRSNERSSTLLICLCSPQFVSAVELGRYWYILIYRNIHWHDMISIPSVQLSIWQVKVHVWFYCTCSEQLPRGVVQTLTASWLCTMAANAGASENRIVPNKKSKSLVWTYFGFPCDVDPLSMTPDLMMGSTNTVPVHGEGNM